MVRSITYARLMLAAAFMPLALNADVAGAQSGSRQNVISASERSQGAKAHPQLLEQFGGAYSGRQAAYVTQVGRRIAMQSGIADSQSAYTVTLLNSNAMNAFAIPGGYVYVTRQLLATMNDEAELAFVLGHEVAHVAARHSKKRNTQSTLATLGSVLLGAVTGSSQIGNLAGQAGQYLVLGYSRNQEYQADTLGVRYLAQAGYDPFAAPDMLAGLGAQSTLEARLQGKQAEDSTPSWASTHPLTSDRVTRARALAQKTPVAQRLRNRDTFLAAIDGMLIDDDPRQGIVDGRTFRHPDLRIGFDAPQGYTVTNSPNAVTIEGRDGQAQFGSGALGVSLPSYIDGVFKAIAGQAQIRYSTPQPFRSGSFEGMTSSARASTKSGQVDVTVTAFRATNSLAYHFVTITRAGSGLGPFGPMLNSFRRLTSDELGSIRPRRLDVVTVRPNDTVQTLSARMAYPDYRLERFLALNGLATNERLQAGSKVKIVVYGNAR